MQVMHVLADGGRTVRAALHDSVSALGYTMDRFSSLLFHFVMITQGKMF